MLAKPCQGRKVLKQCLCLLESLAQNTVHDCCLLKERLLVVMQLFCDIGDGVLEEHSLDVHDEGCSPISHNEDVSLHTHGPSCGHERVLHGDHYDYLVRTS